MRAGKLQLRIDLQEPDAAAVGPGGEVRDRAWRNFRTGLWAERIDGRGSESMIAGRDQAVMVTQFRLRWLEGLREDMRVVCEGVVYRIIGVAEPRRRAELVLTTERVPGAADTA